MLSMKLFRISRMRPLRKRKLLRRWLAFIRRMYRAWKASSSFEECYIYVVYTANSQVEYFMLYVNAIEMAHSGDLLDVLFFLLLLLRYYLIKIFILRLKNIFCIYKDKFVYSNRRC